MFLHDWKDSGLFGVIADFEGVYITKAEYEAETSPHENEVYWLKKKRDMSNALQQDRYRDIEVLLASYTTGGYEGSAFVLFRNGGRLYEVNGGHCSCHGLEGQWEPEETTVESLRHRLDKGTLGYGCEGSYSDELRAVLDRIEAEGR